MTYESPLFATAHDFRYNQTLRLNIFFYPNFTKPLEKTVILPKNTWQKVFQIKVIGENAYELGQYSFPTDQQFNPLLSF